jgi:hypothetical protein
MEVIEEKPSEISDDLAKEKEQIREERSKVKDKKEEVKVIQKSPRTNSPKAQLLRCESEDEELDKKIEEMVKHKKEEQKIQNSATQKHDVIKQLLEEEKVKDIQRNAVTLAVPQIDIDIKSEETSSEELEIEDLAHEVVETPFTVNEKFTKRVLVFKKHSRDKSNVYQGEVSRLRKRLGIISSKQNVYLCINKDRINMYNLPLNSTPTRQFIYDCEQIN